MKHLKSYKLFELHSDTYKDTYRKMKVTSIDRADNFKLSYREKSYNNLSDEFKNQYQIDSVEEFSELIDKNWHHITDDDLELVRLKLNDAFIDPSDYDNYAIRWASERGHLEVVKLLLQDERIDPSDYDNYTIRYASDEGHVEVVELLLQDERVDPSDEGNCAIRYASDEGHLEVVKLLLQDDRVDPSDNDNYAIGLASSKGHLEIVKLLAKDERVQQEADLSEEELLKKYLK